MNKASLIACSLIAAVTATAAFAGDEWLTDFEKAKQVAATRHVPILAEFSGSDWCPLCIRLHRGVFSQPEFKNYAETNLVLFLPDFPDRKPQSAEVIQQNEELQERYGVKDYPTLLLLDPTGKELARTGYRSGGVTSYVAHIERLIDEAWAPRAAPPESAKDP